MREILDATGGDSLDITISAENGVSAMEIAYL